LFHQEVGNQSKIMGFTSNISGIDINATIHLLKHNGKGIELQGKLNNKDRSKLKKNCI